ncbi:MAG: response regulator, partial [Anaerolineaceae bacterium]|nr:response regulator [Anaerolineaceae bacterium]
MDIEKNTWRILLVDDDEEEYLITREMLTTARWGNFVLEWASNYADGLAALHSGRFDAALVDFQLGPQRGIDLILTSIEAGCQTPILLVTGQGSYEIDLEAMEAGAADYLNKGDITPALLERSIRFAIQRKQGEYALLRANAALRESEGRFRIGLENAMVTVFTQDRDLRFTWVYNPLNGYTEDEVLGKRDCELHTAEELNELIAAKQRVLESGTRLQSEITTSINGEKAFYLLSLEPIHAEDCEIAGLRGSMVDITHMRQLEIQQNEHATRMEVQHRLLEQREMERMTIARNLHDGPVQDAVGLVFSLQSVINSVEPCETQGILQNIRGQAKELAAELRSVCNELRPPSLMRFGLNHAIRSHAYEFQLRHGSPFVKLELENSSREISDAVRLALFRIYQAGLTNTLRHAQASEVIVRMESDE